jgi:uncharacterized protein (DUF924 family)
LAWNLAWNLVSKPAAKWLKSQGSRLQPSLRRPGKACYQAPFSASAQHMPAFTPQDVVKFWYEAGPERWFSPDPVFDRKVRDGWLAAHEAAARGQLSDWEANAEGMLALLLLLDQFPRNMFRDMPHAYATDLLALGVATRAMARRDDQKFKNPWKRFFYLPFMHSERLADQERCLDLCRAAGDEGAYRASLEHLDIIARFGRFPHRNGVLGRETTPAEQAFLDAGGFAM